VAFIIIIIIVVVIVINDRFAGSVPVLREVCHALITAPIWMLV
jgi:hypothetical protein